MIGRQLILATVGLAAAISVGCAGHERDISMRRAHAEHLLFNPSWTGLPTLNAPRAEWPSTVKYEHSEEVFEYSETIIDREDSFGSLPDRYYRRFDAVRIGHGYR